MKKMEDIINALKHFFEISFYIIIGAAVRVMHYAKKGVIDKKRVVITFTFAVFTGVIVNHFLIINEMAKYSGIAVSIAALLGESFVSYLLTNSNNLFRSILNAVFKIDVENKKDEDK